MGASSMTHGQKLNHLSTKEKISILVEVFAGEGEQELNELMRKLQLGVKYMRDLGMPREYIWATLAVSASEALDLDLDTTSGVTAAGVIAQLQLNADA